ncbi:hypothetical protein [Ligilactobacillus pobuzihii]|uniref:hypothetical protein n=1 Tax=Ligilactobacillus pobuzihii TaxID=449659 RepID=UPI000374231A|nr:hypothetical protein [Ligilactobacillus pobuzihii]GEN47526.1 hypothetical protein LPO01_03180 [Ligilactobacillus pobuzihii]
MNFLAQYILVIIQKGGNAFISPVYTYSTNKNIYFDLISDYQDGKTVYLPWEERSIKVPQIQEIKFLPCNERLNTQTIKECLKKQTITELISCGELFGETDEHKLAEMEHELWGK